MYSGVQFSRVVATVAGTQLGAAVIPGAQLVFIKALVGNAAPVTIDRNDGPGTNGWPLAAGESVGPIPHDALTDLQVYGSGTDAVAIMVVSN
jgi:hypothetical protein